MSESAEPSAPPGPPAPIPQLTNSSPPLTPDEMKKLIKVTLIEFFLDFVFLMASSDIISYFLTVTPKTITVNLVHIALFLLKICVFVMDIITLMKSIAEHPKIKRNTYTRDSYLRLLAAFLDFIVLCINDNEFLSKRDFFSIRMIVSSLTYIIYTLVLCSLVPYFILIENEGHALVIIEMTNINRVYPS